MNRKVFMPLVVFALLIAACNRTAAPADPGVVAPIGGAGAPASSASAPTAAPSSPAGTNATAKPPAGVTALQVLPPEGKTLRFIIPGGSSSKIEEQYIWDGSRLIGMQQGQTYLTWVTAEDGSVWRQDPKGGAGAPLLRHLPSVLKDGLTWHQPSGNQQVWFRLRFVTPCGAPGANQSDGCWQLTVLNRSERTIFRFARDFGPIYVKSQDLADPKAGYDKNIFDWETHFVSAEQRERMLKEGTPRPTGPLPAVTEAPAAEFDQAMRQALQHAGRPFVELDVNHDGTPERFEGPMDSWSPQPFQMTNSDGWPVGPPLRSGSLQRTEFVKMNTLDLPLLLSGTETQPGLLPGEPGADLPERLWSVTWFGPAFGEFVSGLPYRNGWIIGDEATIAPDGLLTVTWRMPDAAGHTWTRSYRLQMQNGFLKAQPEFSSMKPTAGEPAWPATPEGVISAAFFARWYDLSDELGRYFADPELARSFAANPDIAPPSYRFGMARVGHVLPPAKPCYGPTIEPAPPAADGSTEFLIRVSAYEANTYYQGKVAFARDQSNHLTIKSLTVTRSNIGCM